jgi:hypothetical protein
MDEWHKVRFRAKIERLMKTKRLSRFRQKDDFIPNEILKKWGIK